MKYLVCAFEGLLLVACLSGCSFARAEPAVIERIVTRAFPVAAGGILHLKTNGGTVQVQSSTDQVVTILAKEKIHADSEAEADERLEGFTLSLVQQGNDITALAKYGGPQPRPHSGSWPPVQADFFITVPANFAVDLDSSGGRVTVGDLAGFVHSHTGGGELNLGRIGGGIEASTGGGSVWIESVENTLQASTGGGSIRAVISGPIKGDCEVQTSGGSMHFTVDRTAGFVLDAVTSTSNVEIDELPITVAKGGPGRSQLAGSVNGGGPLLRLRSDSGSIEILAR
jgi:hypothetical protein